MFRLERHYLMRRGANRDYTAYTMHARWEAATRDPDSWMRVPPGDICNIIRDYVFPRVRPNMQAVFVADYSNRNTSPVGIIAGKLITIEHCGARGLFLVSGGARVEMPRGTNVHTEDKLIIWPSSLGTFVMDAELRQLLHLPSNKNRALHKKLSHDTTYSECRRSTAPGCDIYIPGPCRNPACAIVSEMYTIYGPCGCPPPPHIMAVRNFTRGAVAYFTLMNGFATLTGDGWHYLFPKNQAGACHDIYPFWIMHRYRRGYRYMFYDHECLLPIGYWDSPYDCQILVDEHVYAFVTNLGELHRLFFIMRIDCSG